VYNLITYKKTTGSYLTDSVEGKTISNNRGPIPLNAYYAPVVHFTANGKEYYFESDHFEGVDIINPAVQVMYNKKDPSKAFVNTFIAYWGTPLVLIFPIMVAMAVLILGFGMSLAARKGRKIEDSGITLEVEGEI
jgi:hypothetical protein